MRWLSRRDATPASSLFEQERAPRVVLRFTIVLATALALASAAILAVVHHFALSVAQQAATRDAGIVASTLLQREISLEDVSGPVTDGRRSELDALFGSYVPDDDISSVSLVRRDGLVTYSTDHSTIGAVASGELATEASTGTILSTVSTPVGHPETLYTYAPLGPDSHAGAALIAQPYGPIAASARSAQLKVGAVLEGLLLILVALLVPLLIRVTRRITRQIERIHHLAFFDELTGLPNRAQLFERLEVALTHASESDRRIVALWLDLDRFRDVNDTLGHEAGDVVLGVTARRLEAEFGTSALLARLSGDDFAIVTELDALGSVNDFAERVRDVVSPPLVIDAMQLALDGTVGFAVFPVDGADAESLLKHAEIATYTAKEWRVGVLGYSPAIDPHDPEQLQLTAALREAISTGQLQLRYQPKIDLATNEVAGFEALAYWEHPTRGVLPPGAFIPVAERTGAIRHVTEYVLAGSIAQLRKWEGEDLTIAVNVTAMDLLDVELPERLAALLGDAGVEPRRLCLELTESMVIADAERAQSVLARIAATGVRVSIDDFGTGHSSLAYLKDLAVDEVKIDRSFISDMTVTRQNRMIVRAMLQLAHSLGLDVVAEGVEDLEVHHELRALGCDTAQGYLYGAPQPLSAIPELLSSWNRIAA